MLGTESSGVSRRDAELTLETLRTQARESRLSLPQGRKVYKSLAVAAPEYLDRLTREGGKNLKAKERHFRLYLVPKLGSLPINKISEARLVGYRTQRRSEGAKDTTINREFATLSHFFTKATSKKWKWMSADDVPDMIFTPEPKLSFRVLSAEELQMLVNAAAEEGEQPLLFVQMMLGAPMRCEEALAARFEHVHNTRDELVIPKAKTGARIQRISPELAKLLRRLRWERQQKTGSRTGWLFPSPQKEERPDEHRVAYLKMFYRCVARAKLESGEKITPYTLRRTTITDLADTGLSLAALMEITCHKTVEAMLRYVHTRDVDKANAMRALDRGLHRKCTVAAGSAGDQPELPFH